MKYRKKPVVIDAAQWFKLGDNPSVTQYHVQTDPGEYPHADGKHLCLKCKQPYSAHGWVDTLEGGHIVCPNDWIITGVAGEKYPCKPDIFEKTYERVE